jgi:hypothetical protein
MLQPQELVTNLVKVLLQLRAEWRQMAQMAAVMLSINDAC